jgi:hypothetical protein
MRTLLYRPRWQHKSLTGFTIGFKRLSAEVSSTHRCTFNQHRATRAFQREYQACVERIEAAAASLVPASPGLLRA